MKFPTTYSKLFLYSEIKQIIDSFGSHLHIDLQQRGVEFSQLFGNYNHLREPLLEKMPPMQINRVNGTTTNGIEDTELLNNGNEVEKVPAKTNDSDALLDLLGSGDDIMSPPVVANTLNNNTITPSNNQDLLDLLGGIDLSPPVAPTITTNNNIILSSPITSPLPLTSILDANENTTKLTDSSNFGLIGDGFDMLGGPDLTTTTTSTTILPEVRILTVFDKNDILIQLATQRMLDYLQVIMTTTNNSLDTVEQYLFQVRNRIFCVRGDVNLIKYYFFSCRLQFLKAFPFKCFHHPVKL